jgi:2,5-diamino-6-(ribosylamino)-4(3H)-pyrimidinone 5'-phosphate reductase
MQNDATQDDVFAKETPMLPQIFIHNEISLDGRIDWMADDQGLYYETIARWPVDAMLSGSQTILDAIDLTTSDTAADFVPAARNFDDLRQLLVVVDSRGQIENWTAVRDQPYWRDVVVLCSLATPPEYLDSLRAQQIEFIVAGEERVDLRAALVKLRAEFYVETMRVDSGGVLNGVLLRAGLVQGLKIILNPCLTGGTSPRTLFVAPDLPSRTGVIPLELLGVEQLRGGYLLLEYKVALPTNGG